jgi:hypothetical protein
MKSENLIGENEGEVLKRKGCSVATRFVWSSTGWTAIVSLSYSKEFPDRFRKMFLKIFLLHAAC